MDHTVAIVGSGPSGGALACLLADREIRVLLFDPKTPWEHPRGPGLSLSSLPPIRLFDDLPVSSEVTDLRILSPRGRESLVQFPSPIKILSREEAAGFLVQKAVDLGVTLVSEKVEGVERRDRWHIRTENGEYTADFLCGADGASHFIRPVVGSSPEGDSMTLEASYLLPRGIADLGKTVFLRFSGDQPGFFWIAPFRQGHSIGLWATGRHLQARTLFEKLERLARTHFPLPLPPDAVPSVARISPFSRFSPETVAGNGWALVGEAAGLVDPFTAGVDFFGLRSAAFLAETLENPQTVAEFYPLRLKKEMIPLLKRRLLFKKLFYRPLLLEWLVGRVSKDKRLRRFLLSLLIYPQREGMSGDQNGVSEILKSS